MPELESNRSNEHGNKRGGIRWSLAVLVCLIMLLVRLVALSSDPYPGLSWSSALLTDEGFYVHNARNLVLFGAARTDDFNNMMIMPTLHVLQVCMFRIAGVGLVQARLVSVVLSLASLPLFWVATNRSMGRTCAFVAVSVLGLDHTYFLYNRLALMDSPAASVLTLAFFVWVLAIRAKGTVRIGLLACTGLAMIAAYGIRGLAIPVMIAPYIGLVGYASACKRQRVHTETDRRQFKHDLLALLAGNALGGTIYAAFWYLPNRQELKRLNQYYSGQLLPRNKVDLGHNIYMSFWGDGRGLVPYLLHHTPVVFLLSLGGILLAIFDSRRGPKEGPREANYNVDDELSGRFENPVKTATLYYTIAWICSLWAVLIVANYSPSRYYVLSYPAMALLAGWSMDNLSRITAVLRSYRLAVAAFAGLCVFHAVLAMADRAGVSPNRSPHYAWSGLIVAFAICCLVPWHGHVFSATNSNRSSVRVLFRTIIACWALTNIAWIADWSRHISYRQVDADHWLGSHLPERSVVIGAMAPGLCIDNHLVSICMIEGLCNDRYPVERYAARPEYIAILDDNEWREEWWIQHYPSLITSQYRIQTFQHMLRPRFNIGVYSVRPARIVPLR